MARHYYFTSRMRKVLRALRGGDSRQDASLEILQSTLARMETQMAQNHDEVVKRLKTLRQEVADYTTQQGEKLAEKIAEARAAFEAEDAVQDKARIEAALAECDNISNDLKGFQPSGN